MRIQPAAQGLSARLQDAIRAKGTTAAAVAKACGFSRQNMQRFVNGEVTRSRHFTKIAEVLGVSALWLTMGDHSSAPSWWSPPAAKEQVSRQKLHDNGFSLEFLNEDGEWGSRCASLKSIVMRGDRGRPVANDGMRLLLDTEGSPSTGDIIVLTDADGMELVCCGDSYDDRIVVSGVDSGHGGRLVAITDIAKAPIVVGVLF